MRRCRGEPPAIHLMRSLDPRPPAQPDLANVFVPWTELLRESIDPPKPRRRRLHRSTPVLNPFT